MTGKRGFRQRLVQRLRYGLLTQEVLDRLAGVGVRIYPYLLVYEPMKERPEMTRGYDEFEARFLERCELAHVSDIPERPRNLEGLQARLENGACFGVWDGEVLAAYSWYSTSKIPVAAGGRSLCALPAESAYLYDAYVLPGYRGRRLAGFMRHRLHQALAEKGAMRFFSISLAFNKSTRRFKSRLGAEEFETRLLMTIGRAGGIDIRLAQREKMLSTPVMIRVESERQAQADVQ